MKADYHIHTKRCKHAEGEMYEYVEKAIELQIPEIAFTDHIPLPDNFDSAHRMALNELDGYFTEINRLQSLYPEIKIYSGIEADYYEGFEEYLFKTFQRFSFDLIIMSVHFIKNWPKNNWVFSYYFPDRSIREIYSDYLDALYKGIDTGLFNIVGHMDLIKDENVPLLKTNKTETLQVLKNIKKKSMAVEINTSGLRKEISQTFPDLNFLPYLEEYKIPVLFGSDAHKPEQVGFEFESVDRQVSMYPGLTFASPKDWKIFNE